MSARILIVDDTPASVKVLAAKLAGEFYDVLTARDGTAALTSVSEDSPDLVLLDVMMPGMDGFEVCRRIKSNPRTTHIPVVMVTALSDRLDRVQGLNAGADDFLTKPVSDATLFMRVEALVRMKRMLDQWRLREQTSYELGLPPIESVTHASTEQARVLLINDSEIECANIRSILGQDKAQVTVARRAQDALDLAVSSDPELVVVGLGEDITESVRVAAKLHAQERLQSVPVLLIADESDETRVVNALKVGVSDYVLRPIDGSELLARARTQLRRKRYHDRLYANVIRNLSLALTDSLTGLHNRRYLGSHLEAVMRRMADSEKPVSALMIDIDHFKRVNDSFGHAVGDRVLCEIAKCISRNVRVFDLPVRFGGEEFVVVMPDATMDVALAVAERLCRKMREQPIEVGGGAPPVTVTLSLGVAEMRGTHDTPESLLQRADAALYQAKREGRDRVVADAQNKH